MKQKLLTLFAMLLCGIHGAWAVDVSGTVNASSLADNAEVVLTGNTTIYMDVAKTIKSLQADYPLTISGDKVLSVNNEEGHAIFSDGDIKITGGNVYIRFYMTYSAVRSYNGDITLYCNLTAEKDLAGNENIVYSPGNITTNGSIVLRNGRTGLNAYKNIIIEGGSVNADVENCALFAHTGAINISGDVTVKTEHNAINAHGDIIINDVTISVSGFASEYAIYSTSGSITTRGNITIKKDLEMGLNARKNIIIEGGSVNVDVSNRALSAQTGTITISGDVTAKAGYNAIEAYGDIIINGATVSATTSGDNVKAIISKNGNVVLPHADIVTPVNGSVSGGTIIDSNGDPAKSIYIISYPIEVYTVYDSYTNTLMYFYDHLRESRSGTVELYDPDATRFAGYGPNVTKVIIDPSMKYAAMTMMKNLFYGGSGDNTKLSAMTTIEGLENLNTSRVKSTERMFYGCSALTTLDLTSFSVANVEDMRNMFVSCTNLATIYCNDDWSSTTAQSSGMFTSCGSLVGGNGTEYASGNSDANYARPDDPDNDKPGYFTIKGDVYTVYDATTKTLTYRYDGHYDESNQYHELYDPSATSATRFVDYHDQVLRAVVDPTMKKAPLTSLEKMFYGGWKSGALGLSAMKTVEGLENLNTAIVTNMNRMFINCSALETIDISSFDVSKLKYTDYMFSDCTSLKTIYCDGDWSVLGLANSGRMFSGCTSLVGGKGTLFDSSKDDASYARPDGGTSSPGYFTITKTEVSATIGETEWATFVAPYALDFGGVDGLTAYIVTGYSGSTVETTEVYDVPANTPVLLNGSADTYTIPVIGGSMTDVSSNKLVAGIGAAVEAEAGKTKYVLSASDGKAVFKKINETPATVAWGKAYLMFDGVVEARQLVFDNETGINEQPLSSLPRGGELYNLQGQRIVTSHKGENGSGLPKGLYIVNGKKVIVK